MPESDHLGGDVHVSPRHLAGSTVIGDPGLQPLLDLGWELRHDDLANAYVSAPDHRIRLGYLPEGPDNALWRITAYDDPFASPRWATTFSDEAPTEFVTAFTTALAQAYAEGPHAYLDGDHQPASVALEPLLNQGWQARPFRHNDVLGLTAPDGLAGLVYDKRPLDHEREMTSNATRWQLWGGLEGSYGWYATHSSHTPVRLVAATTAAVTDPAPVLRWEGELNHVVRAHARITPITPPAPAAPTPLDIRRRQAARRPPALGTESVPRWSTTTQTTRPRPATAPPRPGPRR